jgi:hypothetical protein
LQRSPRPEYSNQGAPDQPAKIAHGASISRFAVVVSRFEFAVGTGRSLPNTRENDFDRLILLLWPKGSLVIGIENEGAPRIDSNRIEDALVVLARDYTGLATFSVDETNGGAEPRRSSRAWRPFRSRRSLIALSTCYRVLPARRKRQQQENDKAARLHDELSNYQGCRIK